MFPGMGSGGGGENNVTVNINGTSAMLVEALASATEQMNLTARGMQVLGDAAKILGDTVAASAGAWLDASASATEYGAKLDYLAAQTRMAAESQAQLAGIVGGGSVGGMAGGMGGMLGGMIGGEGLMGLMGGLGDVISGAAGKMMGFVQQAGAMVTGLISFSVLNDVIQQVQSFTDSLISLNEQTEKNVFSWKYLYGGMSNANEIAAWTKQFSMQIPYTRQSLLQAITNLAPMGLSVKGLEHYLPMIADLGATRAPNLDIAQVAQVIMSASMGYTRMLKYDLKINPEELIKYGLDATGRGIGMHINDPTTLLPALENYAKAKGLTGAAKDIAHNTFWGAWSSFIDRIQNFELDTGHGLFGSLKQALNDLSSWIDTHSAQIARFSDLIGGTLAGGFKTLVGWIGEFLTGVGSSGLLGGLSDALGLTHGGATAASIVRNDTTMGLTIHGGSLLHEGGRGKGKRGGPVVEVLPAPPTPAELSGWQQAGQIIGGALKAIGEGWSAVSQFMQPYDKQAVHDLGDAFKHFGDSLSPDDKRSLKELGGALMAIPWVMLIGFVEILAGVFNALGWAMTNVIHPLEDFQTKLGQLKDNLQKWSDGLKKNFKEWGGQFIQAMIDGVTGKLPDFAKTLGNLAGTVANYFQHHSPPKEGPLSSDDQWMPAMLAMWARQLHEGGPQMANALGGVAGAMAGVLALRPHGGYGSVRASLGGGNAGPVTVVINASSTVEVLKLIDAMLARRDHRMNITFRAPGGYGSHQFGTIGGVQ